MGLKKDTTLTPGAFLSNIYKVLQCAEQLDHFNKQS